MTNLFQRSRRITKRLWSGHSETWRRLRFEAMNRPLMFYLRQVQAVQIFPAKVSVITPTCGRIEGLKNAIASVDAQSYPLWEHLIVCDGYFPAVHSLSLANQDPRRHYYFTPAIRNFGNLQRNVGIVRSRGEFLLFLDDDNVIYPEALDQMVTGFDSENIDLVFCPINYDHVKHGVQSQILMPSPGFTVGEVDSLNAMIRRDLVVHCNGWSDSYFADFELFRKAADSNGTRYLYSNIIGHHR
ncbi:glycosyltransferase family A protein [Candidatus Regnicoccus frigidus]|uniref:glycosyltransferase family 2 protein n=2 Tax=Synechococcaceae TaxID=1890426 RepID=UPI0028BDDEA8|nr:glycosyltransferase family A protein [Candidatus Regnicoccus frigidus]